MKELGEKEVEQYFWDMESGWARRAAENYLNGRSEEMQSKMIEATW